MLQMFMLKCLLNMKKVCEKKGACGNMDANVETVSEMSVEQRFVVDLYENYKYIMYATVRKYINDDVIVDDLVQESLIKLIPKVFILRDLNKPALTTYVVYTVRNVAFNYLRDKAIENNHIIFEMFEGFENNHATGIREVESNVLHKEWREKFKAIIKQLPERQQEVLIRKYYLKQSDCDIARCLNCKTGSVRMMLTRARRDALMLLKKEDFTYEAI